METLSKEQRNQLAKVVQEARDVAEAGARKALHALGVDEPDPPAHLSSEERHLRRALRAQARQLGDCEDPKKKGRYLIKHLSEKIAYDQWHRMLFARFLAENQLLISPEHGVAVTLEDCRELAPELRCHDAWEVAAKFAAEMLPQFFRADDPTSQIKLAPEDSSTLQRLVTGLAPEIFLANDALGWVYQFWQAKRKDEVNISEVKIGSEELAPVTQLFTEDYMVRFLLDNTLGAWWTAKRRREDKSASLEGISFRYLRFHEDGNIASDQFDKWPKDARKIRILDPCMGSGHFLVFALPILTAFRVEEEGLSVPQACDSVLAENLFGLEIDPRCTQIAAFNLALAAWKLGGYRKLPRLNLACCGIGISVERERWMTLAPAGTPRFLMGELHPLFANAPHLGSLINPIKVTDGKLQSEIASVLPLIKKALSTEQSQKDENISEMAVVALGIAEAAEILAKEFTLVITNVPYLGRGRQNNIIREFCEQNYPAAKSDLATCFVERCIEFSAFGGTAALVTPQNWLYMGMYQRLRERLLDEVEWNSVVRLGTRAFETISGEVVNVALLTFSRSKPLAEHQFMGLDVSNEQTPVGKEKALQQQPPLRVLQNSQLENPDCRLVLEPPSDTTPLAQFATSVLGLGTGDYSHYGRCFWEFPCLLTGWTWEQGTVEAPMYWGGRQHVLAWDSKIQRVRGMSQAERERIHNQDQSGQQAWGKRGVAIGLMRKLRPTIYTGECFDKALAVLVPKSNEYLLPIWCYCNNPAFGESVRQLDRNVVVANGTLTKVPFDADHWQRVATEEYPNGLPKANSSDPTQWIFSGSPLDSECPLQVATIRLVGYRWPRISGQSFPECPQLGPDDIEELEDDDGVVCISSIKGEQPAPERVRAILARTFGTDWSNQKQSELLTKAGFRNRSIVDWLRNGFFEQHSKLFHQRPFIWHIWDGTKDGFSALVNYHKLDRALLEKLIFTYLGDWIARQRCAVAANQEGSDAKLTAALELKGKLEKILEGEAPYDIFVRWKPLNEQPIGWQPDLNDGVRLNIRPFVTAGVLRKNPKINWKKDRGKGVPSSPWYHKFKGERINDYHVTLAEKMESR
jgi:hypothetical protein